MVGPRFSGTERRNGDYFLENPAVSRGTGTDRSKRKTAKKKTQSGRSNSPLKSMTLLEKDFFVRIFHFPFPRTRSPLPVPRFTINNQLLCSLAFTRAMVRANRDTLF